MGRAPEDCARAVIHQDEVGDKDGKLPCGIKGMPYAQASVKTQLFGGFNRFFRSATLAAFDAESRYIRVALFQKLGQRVIG